MKTRIATSLGIAFVLVFGIVGVMVAFGPMGVQAGHGAMIQDGGGDGDDIGNMVSGVKVEAVPNSPNTLAKWTVQFMNGTIQYHMHSGDPATAGNVVANAVNMDESDNTLDGGTGKDVIMIEFEDDVQFPESLDPDDITITTSMVSNYGTGGDPGVVVANPLGVDIIKVSEFAGTQQKTDRPPDETLVTLEIPDMVDSDDHPGAQGIAPGATVTVVFRQSAGIKNPTESKADEGGGAAAMAKNLSGYKVQVATSNNGSFVTASAPNRAVIARRLILSDQDGPRGSTITVVGLGFRNSITATVWNDKNANGLRDGGEIDLGDALITGSDDFTTTITINNPPFNYNLETNGVNAVDGRNRTIVPGRKYTGAISGATFTESIPRYLLESSIKVTPGTAAIGDRVQVTARDFVAGGSISRSGARISIGGVQVTDFESTTVSSTGDATFEMTIPNEVASGTQNLVISDSGSDIVNTGGARFNIVITELTPSVPGAPTVIVPIIGGINSLTVSWAAPTSGPSVVAYDLRYIRADADETVEANWTLLEDVWTGVGPLQYVVTRLIAATRYDIQLRAVRVTGDSPWSATGAGTPTIWGAIRSFSQVYVAPGSGLVIAVAASGYGNFGHIVETLPPGFSYVSSSLPDHSVRTNGGQDVSFTLLDSQAFTYTVTASNKEGSYSFSGVVTNAEKSEQPVAGISIITVQAAPSVFAASNTEAPVRLNSAISVTVTFSEPVFGFTVEDIAAANGAVGNFTGSDGDAVYTFDVTPNAVGEVTVGIAANVATGADGKGNTAAQQLSLGIPYDDDGDGGISKEEAITAVIDYFAGNITKEEAIGIIILYFSS